jgi:DNA-binding winged helix-turn-helix (wHTH) protein
LISTSAQGVVSATAPTSAHSHHAKAWSPLPLSTSAHSHHAKAWSPLPLRHQHILTTPRRGLRYRSDISTFSPRQGAVSATAPTSAHSHHAKAWSPLPLRHQHILTTPRRGLRYRSDISTFSHQHILTSAHSHIHSSFFIFHSSFIQRFPS